MIYYQPPDLLNSTKSYGLHDPLCHLRLPCPIISWIWLPIDNSLTQLTRAVPVTSYTYHFSWCDQDIEIIHHWTKLIRKATMLLSNPSQPLRFFHHLQDRAIYNLIQRISESSPRPNRKLQITKWEISFSTCDAFVGVRILSLLDQKYFSPWAEEIFCMESFTLNHKGIEKL